MLFEAPPATIRRCCAPLPTHSTPLAPGSWTSWFSVAPEMEPLVTLTLSTLPVLEKVTNSLPLKLKLPVTRVLSHALVAAWQPAISPAPVPTLPATTPFELGWVRLRWTTVPLLATKNRFPCASDQPWSRAVDPPPVSEVASHVRTSWPVTGSH